RRTRPVYVARSFPFSTPPHRASVVARRLPTHAAPPGIKEKPPGRNLRGKWEGVAQDAAPAAEKCLIRCPAIFSSAASVAVADGLRPVIAPDQVDNGDPDMPGVGETAGDLGQRHEQYGIEISGRLLFIDEQGAGSPFGNRRPRQDIAGEKPKQHAGQDVGRVMDAEIDTPEADRRAEQSECKAG